MDPTANLEVKRFLVHRLSGEPAEVVRNVSKKHCLEQWRVLAQMCDPSASGRNFTDARMLYNPRCVSQLSQLPARLAEWKNLETKCLSRSGEQVPPTLRVLALLNMCPTSLQEKLYINPDVASGKLPLMLGRRLL